MQFHIENMTCFGCAKSVTKAIKSIDASAVVEPDPANRKVDVRTSVSRSAVEAVLVEAGYPASREVA